MFLKLDPFTMVVSGGDVAATVGPQLGKGLRYTLQSIR